MLIARFVEMAVPECFLTDPLWKNIHGKHIRVALGPKFGGGNRIGFTTVPLHFDDPLRPSKVSMYWTDNKGRWQQGDLSLEDLKPARPSKSKVFVVVINGDRKGQFFQVTKVTKADETVFLATVGKPQRELAANVCLVEDHVASNCSCSHLQKP
jgi:hypothetical protein